MRSTEKIKKLIKNLDLDVNTNSEADQRVLGGLLQAHEKSRKTEPSFASPKIRRIIMKSPITKLAAVLAVLVGVGAISVVGVNIGRYFYYGKNDEGAHIFHSEDWETVVTLDDNQVTDVEQTRQDLEEIESLYQQGKRELLKVEETLMDGTLAWKVHVYKYELSDGRTIDMREGADDSPVYNMEQLDELIPQLEEFRRLKKAGPGENLGIYEETVEGRVFSFKREKYFLSDGTEVIWSVGLPK